MPLYYVGLEIVFKNIQVYKIQPKIKFSYSEVFGCYKEVMRMFILVVGPLQLVSYPSIQVEFENLVKDWVFVFGFCYCGDLCFVIVV